MADLTDGVAEIGGLIIGIALFVVIISLLTTTISAQFATGNGTQQTADVGVTGGQQLIANDFETFDRAESSLEDAVDLTGANDSNVSIDSDADLSGNWSACTYARADSSVVTADEERRLLATEHTVLWYNGSSDNWQAYYYNASSRTSYYATVSAPTPGSDTLVCVNHHDNTLNVSANTTTGTGVDTTAANTESYPSNISSWDGVIEETRLYDTGALSGSERTEWVSEPGLAIDGRTPGARVTYDTRESSLPSSFTAYFGNGDATVSNASLVTGYGAPAISEGSDYSVSSDGRLSINSSGQLDDNGEVLYVWYVTEGGLTGPFASVYQSVLNLGPVALSLLVVGTLVLASAYVVGEMDAW